MNMQKLLIYTKEELITYILKHRFFDKNIEEDMQAIHRQFLLEKENAELDCQMNRNKYCYSCVNATDRCFRNEIGCPCEKYKSYKDLNKQLTKAKELIKEMLSVLPKENIEGVYEITEEAEQFIREAEK